jgi:hypothetical protein
MGDIPGIKLDVFLDFLLGPFKQIGSNDGFDFEGVFKLGVFILAILQLSDIGGVGNDTVNGGSGPDIRGDALVNFFWVFLSPLLV